MRRILLNTLLFMGLAHVMPGVKVTGFGGALISAFVFALLSVTVKPVLEFFACPLNFLSLGLVNWLIAGFILLLASWLPGGLTISSIWSAMLVAVALSLGQSLVGLDSPYHD